MITIELAFHHFDNLDIAYYKPVGEAEEPGPSVLVNRTFRARNFRGVDPEQARLTLIGNVGDVDVEGRAAGASTRVALRFDHDDGRCTYYKPVDDNRRRGASVLVNQTFVGKYFRRIPPEHARLTLVVDNAERGPGQGA